MLRVASAGRPYDGTWSVAIYTLRGDCGSVRVAVRIVGGRVYSQDQSYQASGVAWSAWALPALVDPHRAPAGYPAIPVRDDGGRREESAPALGQPREA
jgi:hypothetical protein